MISRYKIIILPKANEDVLVNASWYQKQDGEALALKFKHQIISTIEKIKDDFISYAEVYMGLRRIFVKQFPYSIYFVKSEEEKLIIVYAVLHNKQTQRVLNKRI
ncbi:hypothetical protein BH11BAC5_BH11BAC5_24780 [soil metagenome]|jgi:toxin ParE1/3/4